MPGHLHGVEVIIADHLGQRHEAIVVAAVYVQLHGICIPFFPEQQRVPCVNTDAKVRYQVIWVESNAGMMMFTLKTDTKEKWENILQLYNELLFIDYSPIAALKRTYALAKVNGKEEAIREAEKIKLTDNHLYHSLLGDLYTGIDTEKAVSHLQNALFLAKSAADKIFISHKILECLKKENKS